MTVERIDEIEGEPVVGRFYLVPTVRGRWNHYGPHDWPVMGPRHDDAAILGFGWLHYHIDPRFLSRRLFALAGNFRFGDGPVDEDFVLSGKPLHEGAHSDNPVGLPPVAWRRRRCHRARAGRRWLIHHLRSGPRLEDAYQEARLKPGMVCPHKGYCLKSEPVAADGSVVCPLHGLIWDVETGRLRRQFTPLVSSRGAEA